MSYETRRILGLARARTKWFSDVSLWANTGLLGADFIKCVSADELKIRLTDGQSVSAVLVDLSLNDVDDALLDLSRMHSGTTVGIGESTTHRPVKVLPASAISLDWVQNLLTSAGPTHDESPVLPLDEPRLRGKLVAVCGPGNTGTSTLACGLAQQLADPNTRTLLIDAKRSGDLAMMHDAPDVVPNIEDLLHRSRNDVNPEQAIDESSFFIPSRQYSLVLGMCRPYQWVTFSESDITRCLDTVVRSGTYTIVDIDSDLEGHDECGSWDIQDRHLLSRLTIERADVVVVVGNGGLKGIHALARHIRTLVSHGVPADRIAPVINRMKRNPVHYVSYTKTLSTLVDTPVAAPIFVNEMSVEAATHEVRVLPVRLGSSLASRVRNQPLQGSAIDSGPQRIVPGTLLGDRRTA